MKTGFPLTHLITASVIGLGMASLVVAKFSEPDHSQRFTTEAILLDLPQEEAPRSVADSPLTLPADLPPVPIIDGTAGASREEAPVNAEPGLERRTTQVRPGDSLARIFKREGIPARELQRLLAAEPLGQRLKDIFPGHEFSLTLREGTLVSLEYSPGPLETLAFERVGGAFEGRELVQEPERTTNYVHGVIDHSLFVSSQRAGLDDAMTMRLAQMFQWDIDFVLDIRSGDEFFVLFEELYLGEKFIGYGDILAAEFVNQGDSYRAVRYLDANGKPGFFAPDGRSVRKAFLRAPVEFSRISSNFNLRRKHPLFNRNMPHRGIDYAAPSGTPILASGDGRVLQASSSKPNGNFVVIQHGEQFVTKYLHLSKFARGVRAGARVKQGQTIGYVGSTGYATGPHLHYEFLVNGVHQNPRTVKLPDAAPVHPEERDRFRHQAAPLLALLDNFKEQVQLAMLR